MQGYGGALRSQVSSGSGNLKEQEENLENQSPPGEIQPRHPHPEEGGILCVTVWDGLGNLSIG